MKDIPSQQKRSISVSRNPNSTEMFLVNQLVRKGYREGVSFLSEKKPRSVSFSELLWSETKPAKV